jgi:hypothetical protein
LRAASTLGGATANRPDFYYQELGPLLLAAIDQQQNPLDQQQSVAQHQQSEINQLAPEVGRPLANGKRG